MLARDGHICRIEGPRCTGYATTVHHKIPSSQRPDLFWSVQNLEAACAKCNYGQGAGIAAGNRRAADERISELDVNPLICAGERIIAVDALIAKRKGT